MMAERYSQYIKDPEKILDILDTVIRKLTEQCHNMDTCNKAVQLGEISKTISRLKNSGASVPDELRKMKVELSTVVSEHENVQRILQSIEMRLSNTMTELRARIKQLTDRNLNNAKRRKHYVKRTSPKLLRKEISKALRELGGSAKKSEVIERIRANMDGRFKPDDVQRDPKGVLNWEKWVASERSKMIKEGALKAGLNQRIWELRRK